MNSQAFPTEFGHSIPIIPDYFARNNALLRNVGDTVFFNPPERVRYIGEPPSFVEPAKDLVAFSAMIQFLHRWNLLRPWEQSLDLGGAHGTCAALFKAAGIVKHTTNLDLADYSAVTGGNYFANFVEFFSRLETQEGDEAEKVRLAIQKAKWLWDLYPQQDLKVGLHTTHPFTAEVDEWQTQDIFEATGKYDLVSTFYVFDLLDLDRALAKVRELLTDDGLFVCSDEYWWFPINSSMLVGHFPYAMQRLSYKDLERYIAQYHPEILPTLRDRYYYLYGGTQPPTINDWFKIARRQGLRPVAFERVVPKRSHRIKDCPPTLLGKPWFDPQEVLRDIEHLRPGVTLDDLMTADIHIAMVKA